MAPLRSSIVKALGATLLLAFFGCDSPSAPKTGSLVLSIQGLPAGTDAAITITGPTGTSTPATKAETLTDLPPGNYTVTASVVTDKDDKYTAANSPLIVTVTGPVLGSIVKGASSSAQPRRSRLGSPAARLGPFIPSHLHARKWTPRN